MLCSQIPAICSDECALAQAAVTIEVAARNIAAVLAMKIDKSVIYS